MDQQNLTLAKIPILDTGKFEQWKFRIQQHLQHEHYALWEVIEFRDSYEAPKDDVATSSASEGTAKNKGRTVAVTTEDIQKKRNDVKERTTLLLALPDEHQLRFSKYKTAQELWAAILKTFGGNEATKKTKKNLLKQQYGNFKAEGSETLKQTFNRLQVIVSHLEFMEIEIEQDDLNQKFLTSLAPEWLMHTIVWRNRSNLDTMSLDDLYNHLKIKYEDINQIDEDDIEEMDIKWNMALLSMRADRFWKKTGKKISIQGTNVASFDNFMENEEENHALVADEEAPTEFALMAKSSSDNEVFDNSLYSKACKKNTNGLNSKVTELSDKLSDTKNTLYHYKLEIIKKQKERLDCKLTGFQLTSKDLDNHLESQRSNKNNEGLGYSVVSPPLAQVYSPVKKDMSWTGLPEFADDTITDYSRPSPAIESNSDDLQNRNPSVTKTGASSSTILSKHAIKFVKAVERPTKTKTDKVETAKKPAVKYAELYRKTSKSPNVRGNQRNWNNLKSHQLGKNIEMKHKACFNCGDFNHLSYDYGKWVDQGKSWVKNNYTHKSRPPRTIFHKSGRPPMRTNRPNMNAARPKRTFFYKPTHSYVKKPFQKKSAVRTQSRVPRVPTGTQKFPTINRKFPTVNRKFPTDNTKFSTADMINIDEKGYWDSGCSWHMTGNISYLSDYEPFNRGYVSFGQGGCKITGKGTIKTGKLEFENVYVVKDFKYNLFSVS
nr:hypothetical protein [Tanacetum cinerariifolium]